MERLRFLPRLIVLALALAFTAAVLGFGGVGLRGVWRQVDAGKRFTPVQATVLTSEVKTSRGKRGRTNYRPSITYQYEVDGRSHTGDRESFTTRFNRGGRSSAEAVVAAHPAGSTMTIFVDPADPATAVRRRELNASDLGVVIFLTPFLGASLLLWAAAARTFGVGGRHRAVAPGHLDTHAEDGAPQPECVARSIRADDGRTTSLRLTSTSPLMAAAFTIITAGFAAIFTSLLLLPEDAPAWMAILLLGGVVMAGTLGYWAVAVRQASGRCDLHIDRDMRRITLPARLRRSLGAEVPFDAVQGVEVEPVTVRTKHGKRLDHQVMLTVAGEDGQPRRGRLISTADEEEAAAFAAWVRGAMQ